MQRSTTIKKLLLADAGGINIDYLTANNLAVSSGITISEEVDSHWGILTESATITAAACAQQGKNQPAHR